MYTMITILQDLMPYSMVNKYQCFSGTCFLYLQAVSSFTPQVPIYTPSHPRRTHIINYLKPVIHHTTVTFQGNILQMALHAIKHIDYTNSKLHSLGYLLRSLRSVLSLKIIKQVYTSYVHSILNYGIIFWGNSSYCRTIFITQKRIVRIIMKVKVRDFCWEMFSRLGILTLYSQYIFSTLMFVIRHKDMFTVNKELHKINMWHKLDLHVPLTNLTKVQKGVYYSGVTLFNSLPLGIKEVANNTNKFKHELKKFLLKNP